MTSVPDFIPPATEIPPCPVCGQSTHGIEVGTHGRFGMAVRNIACEVCALVYQSPRPTVEDMARYYAGSYRKHYGDVRYPLSNGGAAGPGEAGYEEGLLAWHTNQANNSVALGKTAKGARVLEVGCRHGKTLTIMRDRFGVEPYGIEPGPEEAEQARAAGVDCQTGTIEEYSPGEIRFDQIQLFHVLEHLHQPLEALVRMRGWLAPAGRLVLEVPNVYQPYGLLEENFFQNAHLTNFSAVTLPALLVRAGFRVTHVLDRNALFVVGEPDAASDSDSLPRPFAPEMLSAREHTATWVAIRLNTYGALEKLRLLLQKRGPSMELIDAIIQVLARPSFVPHTVDCVTDIVRFFLTHDAPRAAVAVATAAAKGATDPVVKAGFEDLLRAVSSRLVAA